MEDNPLGEWVLRVGELRVYYETEEQLEPVVTILRVGIKDRNLPRAGDQVFDLTGRTTDEDDQP
jgi:hypothetical protein